MVNSLGSLLLLSLLLEICTLSIIATNSCQGSCDPGQQPSEYCTNPLLCNTCPQGTFSDRNLRFGEKCNTRKTCLEDHMVTIDEGDETHDATCGCEEGYEMSNSVHACYKKSAEEPTTNLAVNTNTTDITNTTIQPVPSTTKTGLVLAIVLPVSILALILIFGLLFVCKNDKFGLKRKLQTICCDRNGLQGDNHVVFETPKRVGGLQELQPLNDEILNADPESNGSHDDTLLVRELDQGGEQNSSAGSLLRPQLTPSETVSRISTMPHLPSSRSYTKSHKENSPNIIPLPALPQQYILPNQQQPLKANDTEPPPVPPVKSEIYKQTHSVLPSDLNEFFMDNLVTLKKYLNMDSNFLTHLYSSRVITPSMMQSYTETRVPDTDKVLNLMTNHLPKRSRQSKILFLKCLLETEQDHILGEMRLTEEQVEYIKKYERGRTVT